MHCSEIVSVIIYTYVIYPSLHYNPHFTPTLIIIPPAGEHIHYRYLYYDYVAVIIYSLYFTS